MTAAWNSMCVFIVGKLTTGNTTVWQRDGPKELELRLKARARQELYAEEADERAEYERLLASFEVEQ